jgi:hypothetical protein
LGLLPRLELGDLDAHRVPFREAPEVYRALDEKPGAFLQAVFVYDDQE